MTRATLNIRSRDFFKNPSLEKDVKCERVLNDVVLWN